MTMTGRVPSEDAPYRNLVKAAVAGDRQSFDLLARRHDAELRGFLTRRVGTQDMDDVAQEVWLAAWTSIKSFSGKGRFKTWLYTIAVFKVRDLYRRRERDRVVIPAAEAGVAEMPQEPMDAEFQRQWVDLALDALTADQRQLLELYYFAELTLPEIAGVLNKSLSAVKYQFYRAHKDVAESMRESAPDSRPGANDSRGSG